MARRDLLSEAIADAKAVKETALANAKLALEEAFTPKLQSMISAKLAEEMDDEMDEIGHEKEEGYHEEEMEEMGHDEMEEEMEEPGDETLAMADEMDDEGDLEEILRELEIGEGYHDEEMEEEMDDDLELESIIRELEMEDAHEEEKEEGMHEEMDDDEELDLDEVIRTLREMAHEEEMEEEMDDDLEEMGHEDELDEAYKTIESLRATINEVNLLNAKLLYTNKLFRTYDLNENQKVKVLENFDRTSSVREVKLVFTTLAENLNVAKHKKTVVREGYASKSIKSSAPKKQIITETNDLSSRWKKLAGLK
tara:strand:- start:23624 stop:24553 length:930 start_codon:yes stop_codon:yes gene_type:complete